MASPSPELSQAMNFKNEGNAAHQRGDYRQAIYLFSKGIELSPGPAAEHILYSNRSASYCLLEDFEKALADAEVVIKLKPDWSKGYSRKGAALHHMKRYDEAIAVYKKGLELDPGNDVMMKGLEEAQTCREQVTVKRFVSEVTQSTTQKLNQARELRKLPEVTWHLEILKDRIWLADPPMPPFRPRSLFLIDVDRLQMLNMTAHPTRDSIVLEELLDFLLQTCFKTEILPGVLEVSDFKIQLVLEKSLQSLDIAVRTKELTPQKIQFFEDTIQAFEQKEKEQWQGNPKFTGVLKQRAQKGIMSVPGVEFHFMKYLLSSAAHFYRSKSHLYFTKALGIQFADQPTKVALVTRNAMGQYGIAMSTIENSSNPMDCGTQSYLFAELSTIPFDDADIIERYGWDIAEDKYPLPTVHTGDQELIRPSVSDLMWYEVVFKSMALFVTNTFAHPTFLPPPTMYYKCTVDTHRGLVDVVITVPPTDDPPMDNPQVWKVLREPPMPPPKEQPLHVSTRKSRSPSSRPGSTTPTPSHQQRSFTPSNENAHHQSHNTQELVQKAIFENQTSNGFLPPSIAPSPPVGHDGPHKPNDGWELNDPLASLINTFDSTSQSKLREQDQTIQRLQSEVDELKEKLNWQIEHTKNQKELITHLQNKVKELEDSNSTMMRDAITQGKKEVKDIQTMLGQLTTTSTSLVNTLSNTQMDLKTWADTLHAEATVQRDRNINRLSKPKDEPVPKVTKVAPKTTFKVKPLNSTTTTNATITNTTSSTAATPSANITNITTTTNATTPAASVSSPPSRASSQSGNIGAFPRRSSDGIIRTRTPNKPTSQVGNVPFSPEPPLPFTHTVVDPVTGKIISKGPQDLTEQEYLESNNVF